MKIRSVSSSQFAGIRNRQAEFADGLNLVIGENESGKSTLADLIYQILFQPAKQKKNSEFIETYFSRSREGTAADFADGTLCFETEDGSFTLSREWEYAGGSSRLTGPDGVSVKNPEEIEAILRRQLRFQEGVYREILFPSQKRQQRILETLLRGFARGRQDPEVRISLESALTRAVLETGGISISRTEAALEEAIRKLGSHWDEPAGMPEGGPRRGISNPWKQGVGEILKLWYEREDARRRQEETARAEQMLEQCVLRLRELEDEKQQVRADQERFHQIRDRIGRRHTLEELLRTRKAQAQRERQDLEQWPVLSGDLEQAERLKRRLAAAEAAKRREQIREAGKAVEQAEQALAEAAAVNEADLAEYRRLREEAQQCRRLLSGMHVAARVERLGPADVRFCSVSGKELKEENGRYLLEEAARMEVPGVLRLELAPAGIDAEEVRQQLDAAEEAARKQELAFGIRTVEELREKKDRYQRLRMELERAREQLRAVSGAAGKAGAGTETDPAEETESEKERNLPEETESLESLQARIRLLCGSQPLEGFAGGLRGRLEDYVRRYGSKQQLQLQLEETDRQIRQMEAQLASIADIPEEFRNVEDPEAWERRLAERLERMEQQTGEEKRRQGELENQLKGTPAEEYGEQVQALTEKLEAKRLEYRRWLHIREVFLQQKEESAANPAADVAARFGAYLDVLSGGRLKLEELDEKLNARLSSGPYELAGPYLSEGTKDTLLLAFRLAMLEHLFPEGGASAVFDDPLTDMDPGRQQRACGLIRQFARRNQVIFFTCDEKYRQMLGGNGQNAGFRL